MRAATIAIAAFAVAANAAALPDGTTAKDPGAGIDETMKIPDGGGLKPEDNKNTAKGGWGTTTTKAGGSTTTTTKAGGWGTTTTAAATTTTKAGGWGTTTTKAGGWGTTTKDHEPPKETYPSDNGDGHDGHNGDGHNGDGHDGHNDNGDGKNDYPPSGSDDNNSYPPSHDSGSSSSNYGDDYTYNPKSNSYGGKSYNDSPKDYTSSTSYDYSQYSDSSKDYKQNYGSYTVKPDYPSGGYTAPASYPPSCGWSKPKPSPPADCDYNTHDWPYNANWPPAGDYGKSKPHYDYKPKGHEQAEGCGVYYPVRGQQVECGQKHKFLWYMPHSSHVQIDIVYGAGEDDCHHYTTIHDNCPNTGSYEWDVPQIAPCGNGGGYGLLVTCKDTGRKYYSAQFDFSSPDFYNTCKHPACPTSPPPVCTVPACTQCTPPPPPPTCPATNVAAPPVYSAAAVPVASGNATTYTAGASGVTSSFSLVAGIAAMVALIL